MENRIARNVFSEAEKVRGLISLYAKYYSLGICLETRDGVSYEVYQKRRLELCDIKDERERQKETALLEVGRLCFHLDSLRKSLVELTDVGIQS